MRLALITILLATTLTAQDTHVERILREVPLIDGHNDLPWQYRERTKNKLAEIDLTQDQSKLEKALHTDIPRLRRGRMGAQFWSVYVPASLKGADAVQATLEQIDVVHRLDALYPDTFALALTAGDITRIHKSGKIASLIGVEGGHSINNSLAVLRQLYAGGARYMTLTHSDNVDWADSATAAPKHDGLSPFGKAVVGEMNRLGMLVDLSHVSPASMHDALDAAVAPVIFSHSSVRAVTGHARNVPDDVLRRLKDNGGVIMVTFVPSFVSNELRDYHAARKAEEARLGELHQGEPGTVKEALIAWDTTHPRPRATLTQVADHIEHAVRIVGIDHVGIGGDLDGISTTPVGLESVADYPALFSELRRRGHSDEALKKIAGLNVLRAMKVAENVAARLQKERPAAEVTIEELDRAK
ncbi:MAG TPA: dipeptidase [Thermoanaerobaculia bacterium]|nr:dipeptidase [Thermoanaerobaculia bacterium]